MCGIVGVLSFNKTKQSSIVNPDILKKMSDVIYHRGPDSNGIWVSKEFECGFAFRRLSIIDLTPAGNQPMSTSDFSVTIVFNGEIYNYLQIREELKQKGYSFRSRTDTEVILYGYKEWGTSIVKKLSGMFAFVLWDEERKLLFGARDRLGKKPLYYFRNSDCFIFASEIKSLILHPLLQKEINIDEIGNYLNFGTSSNRATLFKNIFKIPPSHFFTLDSKGNFNIERYWNPFVLGINTEINENDAKNEIINLLRVAIKDRMMSDVPFGVFLSGGIDSSLNVALMSELMDRPVDTFTVGFKELQKYNELEYARKIVEIFRTNHHEILIDSKDAFEVLYDLVWYEDEPNADPVCIPLYFLSKLTRSSGTIVVQVGEGSDEQFVGYNWLLRDYKFYHTFWKFFVSLPKFLRKSIYETSKPFLKAINQHLPLDFIRRATQDEEYYWSGISIFPPEEMRVLLKKKFQWIAEKPWEYVGDLLANATKLSQGNLNFLQWVLFAEISQRLPELLLMRVDKMGMANSIEARVPFLDYRLIEFTMSLPEKLKVPNGKTTKYLLKKAVEGILPDEIIYRKKQGFWAPINEWLRNEWFEFASARINNSNLFKNLFEEKYLNFILNQHKNGKGKYGFRIFTLLNLALWYEKFFDNQKIE
ncbi:MAG: Asparagine synthetase [glutamine-hydrolyzing] [Candidatus Kapaibacterium sp.]|nr:MAG: Asparagine synthetase [glutamine-hydrolyzing] [Candidatus Kapabacteria bacterium]